MKRRLILSLVSGLLFGFSWPTYGYPILIFVAIVPLLQLVEGINKTNARHKGLKVFGFTYLAFFIWNLSTTWWILNSTIFGGVFAIICNSSFFALILTLYRWAKTRIPKITAALFLISLWIAFEKFHQNWDFSWPWLTLGNVFSDHIGWIQWYEFTGVFGGSLWVLVVNFLLFNLYEFYLKNRNLKLVLKKSIVPILGILLPLIASYVIYNQVKIPDHKIEVIVLQPNIDPYEAKYNSTNNDLIDLCEKLIQGKLSNQTRFVLTPEGYLDEGYGLNLDRYTSSPLMEKIDQFLAPYPQLSLLTGVQSFRFYGPREKAPTATANKFSAGWIDVYNSAFFFDKQEGEEIYHKSKLVVGVEYMPYKSFLEPLIGEVLLDFGGTIATRGYQVQRSVFTHPLGMSTAPIICYESIYGAFVTEYVRKGAQFLSIITNDAWWGNTQGHQQLLSYARLRSIENRRAIARSANTGISAFINPKGEIIKRLPYLSQGSLVGEVSLSDEITFYTQYGDFIARWATFLFFLFLSIAISGRLKEK